MSHLSSDQARRMRCKLNGQHRAALWRKQGFPTLVIDRAIIRIRRMFGVDLISAWKLYAQQQAGLEYHAPVNRGDPVKRTVPVFETGRGL
jgi:hypothetical protein